MDTNDFRSGRCGNGCDARDDKLHSTFGLRSLGTQAAKELERRRCQYSGHRSQRDDQLVSHGRGILYAVAILHLVVCWSLDIRIFKFFSSAPPPICHM